MKPLLLITFCSLFYLAGTCQDSTITLSAFEMYSSQPRKMLKTEIREIGAVGSILVTKLKTTDITYQSSVYAISIDYDLDNSTSIINPTTLYIDIEDLDSVIIAITYFMKEVNQLKTEAMRHFSYITKGDVEVSYHYTKWSGNWRFSIGKVYKVLRSAVPKTTVSLNRKRVSEFVDLLNQAKTIVW